MKTRSGFVSNSSSSSFIIAYKENIKPCPTCGHVDSDVATLKTIIKHSDESCWEDQKPAELLKRQVEDYGEENTKMTNKIKKLMDEGYKFAYITGPQGDYTISNIVNKSKSMVMVQNYQEYN